MSSPTIIVPAAMPLRHPPNDPHRHPAESYSNMAMAMRSEFIKAVSDLAAEVWDFHDRWDVHDRLPDSPAERMRLRRPMLQEEMRELDAEFDSNNTNALAEEATDVAFVAIGHLAALENLALESIKTVVSKNAAKSHTTHYIDPATGKITRRK